MILKKSVSLLLVVMMSLSVLTVPVYAEQESSFLITSFDELEDDVETQYITDEDQFSDLVLPQELTAMGYTMLGGEDQSSIDLEEEPHEITFYEVDWKLKDKEQSESVRNSSSSQNTYVFAPVLTGSCILAEGVELPEVTAVTAVAQPMMMSLMSTLAAGPFVVPNSAPELANHLLAENSDITISGGVSSIGVLTATSMFDSINLGTMSVGGKATSFSLPPGILVTSGDGTPPETNTSSSYGVESGGPSDSDVENYAGVSDSKDSFSLKFDFTVPEGIPAVSFMFMFGSDEYPEYLDDVVDGAAIIVDDVNYAKFEGGIPLKVVSDAELNTNSGLAIEYDGISAPKVINALLDKTRTIHTLKIVIADTSDTIYDTGLFISAMKTSTSEVGGIIARNDASLISVAGKNDSTPGGQTGANPENSIIWDINVPDSQTAIDIGDIQVAPEASFELYSDPQFTLRLTGDESISLIQGDIVPAYVKVTAIDGVTEKFYSVNIRRDLGTIDLSDIIVTPYSGEYDGENHSIAVVDTNGGTVTYSTSETGEYTIDNPAYKNVGSYTVYYKVDRGAGYNVLNGSSTVEINKADINPEDITVIPYSGEYDGENHSIAVVDANGGTITYSTSETGEYTTENPAYKNIGSFTVYYKVDRGTNFNVLNDSSIVEISKINIAIEDITVTPYSGEYDGANHSITVVDTNGGTVTYSTNETGEYTTENPAYKNVGSYTVYYKVDRGASYNVLNGSSTVKITKTDIDSEDITVTPYSGEYDGENHSIAVVDANGGTVTYSTNETGEYTTENPAYKNVGSYTTYYKVDRGTNYNVLKGSSTVEITKADIDAEDITVTPYSGEYDGENHSITVVDANGGTITYSTSETGYYTTENPTYKNAGSYTTYYKVDRGENYNVLKGSSTVEISKLNIDAEDITVTPYSGEYDGESHSITVADANGGTVTYSTSETGEYTTENPAYKNVGSYTVYYKVDRGTNYNVLKGSSTVEIAKTDIDVDDITVTPYSGEYDGESHSITVVDTNGGTVTYSTSETGEYTTENPAYKNVGSYTVYYKVDRGTNYNVLKGSSTVEIAKTDIDVDDITVTPYSGEYDGESHSITVVDTNGGTVTYSTSETGEYTTENPAYKNVGSYTVYYKVDRGTNYNVLKGSSTVEIAKTDIDVDDITVTPYSGEYDGESHSITVVDTNGGTVTYSTSETGEYTTENPAYKNVGSYTVYYKVDRGTNYNVLKGSSTVEIAKTDIDVDDITVTPYSGEYDGESHSITVVDTNGGTVTYSTSETGEYTTENPAYKNVGSYTVYYKVDRGTNYNVLKGSSTVEIAKTDIDVDDITVTPYSGEYDGENHSIIVVDTNGGIVTYSTSETGEYTTENPAYKNVGSYTVYYRVDRGTNYNVLSGSSTVEMDFREVTLKGITITDKTYDGTTDATSNVTGAYLDGVIEGDDIVLDSSNMIAMFNDEKVNNDKSVTISGYVLSGLSASQYNLLQPKNITGNIIAETSFDMNISIDQVVTAEETDYDGEWTSSDVIITLSGDAPSGIEKYQYTTDGGSSWIDITDSSLLINDTTDKAYAFRAISNGGMNSDSSNIIVVKIDKTKPTIQSIQGNPTTPKNTPQIITFEIFEENSGIDLNTLTVSKDGTNIEIKNENGKYSFIADVNGKYDINVSDNVGNAADMEVVEVNKLDFEKPIISSLVPANNAQPVDGGLLTAIFNEDVMKSKDGIGGDITIFNSNGEVFERIDIKNNRIKVSEKQVNIYLTKPLRFGVEYYVTIDSDIICDIAGNNFTGIADSNIWRFKTSNTNNNSIIGINLLVMGEQYKAIVDPSDETVYSVIAKPNVDGKVKVKVTPVFLIDAKSVITTENEGVEINGDTVTITDIDKETANVKIQIKNADGSIDENKIYTLIIHRGSLETKVTKSGISVDVDADNLRGAVDVSSDISDGKQMELELGIADNGNSISESQKLEIENFLRGRSVAMYLDIDLKLKNITNNTETLIENTQNPIKIKNEIPENMRGGRDYKIIRVHNGVIEILDTVLEGNYLIFETDRFSQYAISYTPDKDDDDTYVKNNQNESLEKHMSYIKGYEDTTFRPENNITRAEAATIIARLSSAYDEHKYYINIYGDVDAQAWYANTVSFGAQNKFILGYEDGSFRPDASITRAELVSIIARFSNVDSKGESELQFADVSGHWASGSISALYKLGWINGYEDGSFRPDAAITRAEAVKIINASLGRTPIKERVDLNISKYFVRFTDISDSNWAYYDILESSITHTAIDFN